MRGVIFFACGYGETVDMYGGYFEEYARQGFRVFSFDYRGFGLSPGEPATISSRAVKDFVAFIDLVVAEYDLHCAQKFLYGVSLGAVLCAQVALERPYCFVGMILINPWFQDYTKPSKTLKKFLSSKFFQTKVVTLDSSPDEAELLLTFMKQIPNYVSEIKAKSLYRIYKFQEEVINRFQKENLTHVFFGLGKMDRRVSNKVATSLLKVKSKDKEKITDKDLVMKYEDSGHFML